MLKPFVTGKQKARQKVERNNRQQEYDELSYLIRQCTRSREETATIVKESDFK